MNKCTCKSAPKYHNDDCQEFDVYGNKKSAPWLVQYRSKYGYLNEFTLKKAVVDDPNFIRNVLTNEKLTNLVKAYLIESLATLQDVTDVDFIKNILKHEKELLVREACYITLNGLSDIDKTMKDFFTKQLTIEIDGTLQKVIKDCIEYITMMED